MISASVPDSERVLQLLLSKGADVNEKSEYRPDARAQLSPIMALTSISR
jgi:hypothetical protein